MAEVTDLTKVREARKQKALDALGSEHAFLGCAHCDDHDSEHMAGMIPLVHNTSKGSEVVGLLCNECGQVVDIVNGYVEGAFAPNDNGPPKGAA